MHWFPLLCFWKFCYLALHNWDETVGHLCRSFQTITTFALNSGRPKNWLLSLHLWRWRQGIMFSSKQHYCCGGGDGDVEDDRVDDKFPMVEKAKMMATRPWWSIAWRRGRSKPSNSSSSEMKYLKCKVNPANLNRVVTIKIQMTINDMIKLAFNLQLWSFPQWSWSPHPLHEPKK